MTASPRTAVVLCLTVAGLLPLAVGCESADSTQVAAEQLEFRAQSSAGVVGESVASLGGLNAWAGVTKMHATILLQVFDKTQAPYANRFFTTIELDGNHVGQRLRAEAPALGGPIRVDVTRDRAQEVNLYEPDPALQERIEKAMILLLQRVSGPWQALQTTSRDEHSQTVVVDGEKLFRVGASQAPLAKAYYYAPGAMLRLLTSGADTPGQDGLVAVYDWGRDARGRLIPQRIRIAEIGRHVLVGENTRVLAEFDDVELK